MVQLDEANRDRLKSALGAALFHALIGYGFLTGLGFEPIAQVSDRMKLFNVAEPPPPPPPATPAPPATARAEVAKPKDPEGAASPANLRDTPTEIVAPPPEIRIPVPPPIVAAPVAALGNAAAAGAAPVPGPGTGSGGRGTGLGSGDSGTGTGGGGGGRGTRARWISGGIDGSDYPSRAFRRGIGGTVYLRFVVAPDGRVPECVVTRSSGDAELDSTTCRLIRRRFRYRPARDAQGRPVAEVVRGEHVWEVGPEPPPVEMEPDIEEREPWGQADRAG